MSHTPGPWTRGQSDATRIFAGPERFIAEAKDRHSNPALDLPRREALDNARLIAAAPDLLAALTQCWEYLDDRGQHEGDATAAGLAGVARAALRKATGET